MIRRTWTLALFSLSLMSLTFVGAVAQEDKGASAVDRQLAALFNDYYEQYLTLFPLEATAYGDMRYNDLLPIRIAPDFIAKERAFYESVLDRLKQIDRTQASDALQLAADILDYEMHV